MPYDSLEWQCGWLAGFAHERDGWPGPRPPGMSCEWVRGYLAGREHYRMTIGLRSGLRSDSWPHRVRWSPAAFLPGALGGTRTPSLLIRSPGHPWPPVDWGTVPAGSRHGRQRQANQVNDGGCGQRCGQEIRSRHREETAMASEQDRSPATIRYVTKTGLFGEIIAPDWSWTERLPEMTEEEWREAAARYIAARYGTDMPGTA